MRSIVIVGAGVAGVELALALALGHPTARVQLIAQSPSLVIRPDLIYAPFGIAKSAVEIPLQRALARFGVDLLFSHVESIDAEAHTVTTVAGTLAYDTLVVATGADLTSTEHRLGLRTSTDARLVKAALAPFAEPAHKRRTIRIAIDDACLWPGPAFEFSLLLDHWLVAQGTRDGIDVVVTSDELEPLSLFGPMAADLLHTRTEARGIELLSARSSTAFDDLVTDLVIDFPQMMARQLPGLPPRDLDGFYAVDTEFRVAPDVHVIGDGNALLIKSGFAAAWQARRLAEVLGARPPAFTALIDDVPAHQVSFELDLVDATLVAHLEAASSLLPPYVGAHVEASIVPRAPRKLAGSLVREHLLAAGSGSLDAAAIEFRALTLPTGQVRFA